MSLLAAARHAYHRRLVERFHRYYALSGPYHRTSWLGVETVQFPGDLIVFQQIVWETKPDLVVETGTYRGGTALFFAHLFDFIGAGDVLTIDVDHSAAAEPVRRHPRIALLTGSSADPELQHEVRRRAAGKRAMLHLDGDHQKDTVLAELRAFAGLVAPGCYAVVADSNLNGHPVPRQDWQFPYGPPGCEGPWEAVEEFLRERDDFEADRSREYQLVTASPRGFLRRKG